MNTVSTDMKGTSPFSNRSIHSPPVCEGLVLRAKALSKSYGGRSVLKTVSVEVRKREVVLLRGSNGSGKTTLLKILGGAVEPDGGKLELSAPSQLIRRFSWGGGPRALGRKKHAYDSVSASRAGIGRMSQELQLFRSLDAANNVAVASPGQPGEKLCWNWLKPRLVDAAEIQVQLKALEALRHHGMNEPSSAWVDQLSLGQAKRVALARVMMTHASILLLDEPLTGLDTAGADDLISELRRIQRDEGATLVISEHDLNLGMLLDLATTVWTLVDGNVIAEGVESVRSEILSRSSDPAEELAVAIGFDPRHGTRTDLGFGASLTVWGAGGAVALSVDRLKVRRSRGRQVPSGDGDGVSFSLRTGQFALLSAPNGWGKSSLLEAISGIAPVSGGEIRIRDEDMATIPPWRRPCSLLRDRATLFPNLTVSETITLGRNAALPASIEKLRHQRVGALSGGERQRLALALTFASDNSAVHLLDEPLTGLDRNGRRTVFDRIQNLLSDACVLVAVPAKLATSNIV